MKDTFRGTLRIGFYSSLIITILTLITFAIAYFTPPLSGPLCQGSCFSYPFLDIASRFPRDYFWMYPVIVLYVVYIVWMVSLHHYASEDRKIYSHTALSFGLISSAVLIIDYFLQISVIQPSLLNGEFDGIAMLSQYNSHGVFVALEEVGYLLMSLSLLFMAPIFSGNRLEKAVRWTFVVSFMLTIAALIFFVFQFGINREYRFEIAAISINWSALIISGILLSFALRRKIKGHVETS